jgi:hypothetical protein
VGNDGKPEPSERSAFSRAVSQKRESGGIPKDEEE